MADAWSRDVRGPGARRLINSNARTIRVQAGPGTGKTFSLVRRVQRILHPDGLNVPGPEVLIVAFNRVIARQLRDDIERVLAQSVHRGDPVVLTVHALCLQAIGKPVRLLLPHEREAMLYDVLARNRSLRERYARHSNTDQALRDHEAKLAKHLPLWQAVRRWLTRHQAHLISDLPGLLLDSIHAGDYEGQRYQHVIVDEFQDLTPGEQLLFTRLRRPEGHFVALGDSKQSIYRFRGNDREGLRNLENLVKSSEAVSDIHMLECHRCPAPMVQAANQLMSLYPPPMASANPDAASIHVVHWKTPQAEAKGLAPHVIANIRANPNDRHLVMVTRRRFGYWLRDHMHELDADIRVDLSFSESLLETWQVREAFLYFTLLFDPDHPTWRAWFAYQDCPPAETPNAPRRNSRAYLRFLKASSDNITIADVERLAQEPRSRQRGQGGGNLWDRTKRLLDLRTTTPFSSVDGPETIEQLFADRLWLSHQSGPTAALDLQLLRTKSLSLLGEIIDANRGAATAEHFRELARRLRYMIATREPFIPDKACNLQVATLWGAKGGTAEHVYIMGLCDEAIPGARRPEYPGTDEEYEEEQRRLFYVSITRSKRTLVLSRAKKVRPGDAMQLGLELHKHAGGRWVDLRMSGFLRDIIDVLPAAVPGTDWPGCC